MKKLILKLLSIFFLFILAGNLCATKKVCWADLTPEALEEQKNKVLAQLRFLSGTDFDEGFTLNENSEEDIDYKSLTKSRMRVSLSDGDESLEVLVKAVVLFNKIDFDKVSKFENKFIETFRDKNLAKNALKYMKLAVETHDEVLQVTHGSMSIDDLPSSFFKLAWRIHWAEKNKNQELADRRKKIFNIFIAFLCGAADYIPLQLSDDEKYEFSDMIAKLKTFNNDVRLNDYLI